jgi:uncharacterized protein (DUF1800 family)
MSKQAPRDAVIALSRFGLGPRPGEALKIAGDPRGFVRAMLTRKEAVLLEGLDLDPSNITMANVQLAQRQQKLARERSQEALREGNKVPYPGSRGAMPADGESPREFVKPGRIRRDAYLEEAATRFDRMITTDHAFLERLVLFWSNHFCVSVSKNAIRGLAGAYEREAIRPHVLGRFTDMLLAVEQHPAMLVYLDNQLSIGPNSPAGRNRNKGLNENLAREILELHTLGVDGGYGQDDVTNLARLIAGWSVGGLNQIRVEPGKFLYMPQRREPGSWSVLSRRYENTGVESGVAVLKDLARHPSTARHVARKFAVHFVGDPPPPALVAKLEASFRQTEGDLAELARTLLAADEAWAAPRRKVLPPNDFLVAAVRGLPFTQRPRPQEVGRLSNELGQPIWGVPSPKGWPEENDAWAGPSALRERLRVAAAMARQIDRGLDPREAADDLFGDTLSAPTREAVARAETREQGFELLLMSPEFQRR